MLVGSGGGIKRKPGAERGDGSGGGEMVAVCSTTCSHPNRASWPLPAIPLSASSGKLLPALVSPGGLGRVFHRCSVG